MKFLLIISAIFSLNIALSSDKEILHGLDQNGHACSLELISQGANDLMTISAHFENRSYTFFNKIIDPNLPFNSFAVTIAKSTKNHYKEDMGAFFTSGIAYVLISRTADQIDSISVTQKSFFGAAHHECRF